MHVSVIALALAFTHAGLDRPTPASVATLGQERPGDVSTRVRASLEARLVEFLEKTGLPGASAALVLPDGRTVAATAGFASREEGVAMTDAHRLLSGSVGKTYVTALAHDLVLRGELELDAPVAAWFEDDDWFAELPNAAHLTLRNLLRHQSGLPRYVFAPGLWEHLNGEPDRVWRPEELLGYVLEAEPLFEAGKGWSYADTNYIVVGMVIERATKKRFYDLVKERFLEPHGLKDTVPTDVRRIPGMTQGYVVTSRQMGVPERTLEDGQFVFNVQFEWCGGGWANTPGDLARWAKLLYGGEALDRPYLEGMLDGVPAGMLGPGKRYGLGVILSETRLGPLRGHDGFMPGFLTTMGWLPEVQVGFALQLNSDDSRRAGSLDEIALELVELGLEEFER